MRKDYIYKRKDGDTTYCYGKIEEDSNFSIVCEDEFADGVWTDNEKFTTWRQVCKFLENNYNTKIEQISTC